MNRKKILCLLTTIPLLLSVISCSNDESKTEAENNPSNQQTTQAQKSNNPPQIAQTSPSPTATNNLTPTPIDPAKSADLTNQAKFLAGMKVDGTSALASLEQEQAWVDHATFFNRAWERLENQQIIKIKKWTSQELTPIYQSAKFIFYPFSGPDFLYCYSFFPQADNYVLVGLEPVGSLPVLEKTSKAETAKNLQNIERSLSAVLHLSFFRTNDMKVDLSQQGVLPILFVFLARTNNKIQNVEYVGLKKDSAIQVLDKENKEKLISGVKIDFIPVGSSQPRSLYYFSLDLSNSGLNNKPEFNKFIQSLGRSTTYLKAASYLPHYDGFSNIRNLILSQSSSLLQDDSGVPIKYFDSDKWKLKFYGNYTQPIALFSNEYQAGLKDIYKDKSNVKPLDFGIGYQYKVNDSNLMLALRKK